MAEQFSVAVGAGSLCIDDGVPMSHDWTGAGVTVETSFTGAHLLHLAVAGSILNDVYREADRLGLAIDGVHVTAQGAFDDDSGTSTGIDYTVALDSTLAPAAVASLLETVDEVADVPRAIRAGAPVRRVGQ